MYKYATRAGLYVFFVNDIGTKDLHRCNYCKFLKSGAFISFCSERLR